jgi:hypothetical protein
VEMLFKIANLAHLHGYNSILFQSFSGIPVKVWTYSVYYILHWNLFIFLAFLTISRLIRMTLIVYLGKFLIKKIPGAITKYWLPLGLIYTAVFFIFLNKIS